MMPKISDMLQNP